MADTPQISGWQYVVLEVVKMLVPLALAVVALWQADKATDRANDAGRRADKAETQIRYYGAKAP